MLVRTRSCLPMRPISDVMYDRLLVQLVKDVKELARRLTQVREYTLQ